MGEAENQLCAESVENTIPLFFLLSSSHPQALQQLSRLPEETQLNVSSPEYHQVTKGFTEEFHQLIFIFHLHFIGKAIPFVLVTGSEDW